MKVERPRRRIYQLLEGEPDLWAGHVVTRLIVAVILVNLTVVCLESSPELAERWGGLFRVVEVVSFLLFTVEYALRLWTAVEMTRFGVMKHLRVLEDAGLVVTRRSGREKLHYLNSVPIRLIHDRWIGKYAEHRVSALADLKTELEKKK